MTPGPVRRVARRAWRRGHLALLRVFGRLPRRLRIAVVHAVVPTYAVGAVCAIEREDRALLLVRTSYRDGWSLPGGLAARGEDIDETARRELREELGLDVVLAGEPVVVVDAGARRVDVVFPAGLAAGVDAASARPRSPEVLDVGWFPLDSLPPLLPESVEGLAALARAAGHRSGWQGARRQASDP